jgi:hypothetical protein
MTNIKDLLKPTGLKIVLSLALLVPSLILSFIVISFSLQKIIFLIVLGIVISYLIASFLDYFIKSRNVKIIIASISGLVSVVAAYIIYKIISEPVICDPVHEPSQCELACREIIENATNRTSEVMQKFQECVRNCYK